MRTFRFCKNRKGAAIELAIMVMVITVSLSIVILTTALLHHSKQVKARTELRHTIALEQIGDAFCATAGQAEHLWVADYPEYEISIDGLQMSVKEVGGTKTLLQVSLEHHNGAYRILVWDAQ